MIGFVICLGGFSKQKNHHFPPPPLPSPVPSNKYDVKPQDFAKVHAETPSKVNTFPQNIKPDVRFWEEISKTLK
jgi:hypothetical protein